MREQGWSRRALLLSGTAFALAACTQGVAGTVPYSVGVEGNGNQVWLVPFDPEHESGYLVKVQSERGIGQASIAWWGTGSPHPLLHDLEVRGLEYFGLQWAGRAVNLSVNSRNGAVSQWLVGGDGSEKLVAPNAPEWITVMPPTAARPSYQLAVPAAFVADGPRVWAFSWVDFYR